MTIQQIQAAIDSRSLDPRQLINLIADYLQTNPPGSPGGGVASVTYAELQTLISNAGLTKGAFYKITDATHSQNPIQVDLGIIVQAISEDGISMNGTGIFINADYQKVGNYSGVSGFAAQKGQWTAAIDGGVVDNDVVIWNKLHYLVADAGAVDATDPATNTTAYTLLPKTDENVGYIEEYDYVEYDLLNDWLTNWTDKRGNVIAVSFLSHQDVGGADPYDVFQWGNDDVWGNKGTESVISCLNNSGRIYANICVGESVINANNNSGGVFGNVLEPACSMDAENNSGDIDYNTLHTISGLNGNSNTGDIENCDVFGGATLAASSNSGEISNQQIRSYSEFADNAAAAAGGLLVGALYRITGTGTINVVI